MSEQGTWISLGGKLARTPEVPNSMQIGKECRVVLLEENLVSSGCSKGYCCAVNCKFIRLF